MNALVERYGDRLAVLAFPCNQFGHQENATNEEIPRMLKYIRPGENFSPKMELFEKCNVNGEDAKPLFKFLKKSLPTPSDEPHSIMNDPQLVTWSPVTRSDISWNFEKFLIRPDGVPYKRYYFLQAYSRYLEIGNIAPDIDAVLSR
ncbi:unnamed protein product [Cyprideis torosa]|uniref:Glutathione peroxidase n=1 Tax=Cyprideis torosa TaxID=163714 RepID=A0A7R8WDB5_9CRUS|nr:unnamed protein product [Cyprideis torosa]CAG0889309.1 unnamed protein product [Cyprideis torosa]